MKNVVFVILGTIFLSGCSSITTEYCKYSAVNIEPVTIYHNRSDVYEDVAESYEGTVKALKTNIKGLEIGEIILKKNIVTLTDKLNQKSIRHRDTLRSLTDFNQTRPCDKRMSNILLAYLNMVKEAANEMDELNNIIENNNVSVNPQEIKSKLEEISNTTDNKANAIILKQKSIIDNPEDKVEPISKVIQPSVELNGNSHDVNFIILSSLFFESGSAKLTEDAKQKLFHIGTYLQNIKKGIIYLVGNSDPKLPKNGILNNNYNLSVQRAKVVGDELKNEYGIGNYKILGFSDNLTTTRDGSPPSLPYDRRVDIYISQGNQLLDLFAVSL